MPQLIQWMTVTSIAMLFLLGNGVLGMLGWPYDSTAASNLTKIHPSTYLIGLTALLSLGSMNKRVWGYLVTPRYLIFLGAVAVLLVRAVFTTVSGTTNGEMSSVIVTFLTPALMLLCLNAVAPADLARFVTPARIFFVVNSLVAIGERLMGHRLIPSFLDALHEDRSAAFLGHPLAGSLTTGLMIVYLTTRRGGGKITMLLPELALHTAAMFAFGGRAALVFTATIMLLSAVLVRQQQGQARVSTFQRMLPFGIFFAGFLLMFLPIPFVDATLDRFTNDGRSSETRNAAVQMLGMLNPNELLMGINGFRRTIIMQFFGSDFGIELAWIALILSYGLIATLPMMFALPFLLVTTARRLDRSAFYMVIMFLATTAGSLAFGTKSTLITMMVSMLYALCQPVAVLSPEIGRRPRSQPGGVGLGLNALNDEPPGERKSSIAWKA